jgi:predicted acyltransferase
MNTKSDQSSVSNRLVSLDAFRGATIAAMILVNNPGSWKYVYPPLRHAEWHGWTFTDIIFPFFLFIVGVAIVFAFSKQLASHTPMKKIYTKIIRRTLILYGLGLFLSGFPYFDFSTIRVVGVLQRIAICYLIASVIFLHTKTWRSRAVWTAGLLLLYWGLMEFIPVPGIGAGSYEKGVNFSNYIDSVLLKGHMWSYTKTWDPEGIISTIPAISTTLFGVLTGEWLKSGKTPMEKTVGMLIAGNIGLFIGSCWHYWLPINKNIWTSSYSVLMAGLALICLGIIYYLIDIRGHKAVFKPAVVYGLNAITVFVLSGIVAKTFYLIKIPTGKGEQIALSAWFYQNLFASWLGNLNGSLAYAITFIAVMYLLMWILYKKKIFIKI